MNVETRQTQKFKLANLLSILSSFQVCCQGRWAQGSCEKSKQTNYRYGSQFITLYFSRIIRIQQSSCTPPGIAQSSGILIAPVPEQKGPKVERWGFVHDHHGSGGMGPLPASQSVTQAGWTQKNPSPLMKLAWHIVMGQKKQKILHNRIPAWPERPSCISI